MIKKAASVSAQSEAKQPVHEQVYQMLRARILFGELAPGQAVTIQGLTDSLGVGMTPVREAIRRLMSEGALSFQGNRRVIVPVLTQNDLQQVIFVRKSIEAELARRAAERMTPEAVAQLVTLDEALDMAIDSGDVGGYLRSNYDFHALLYQVADAPILTEMAERLWLRFGPSLRVVCGRFGTQNLPDRHKEMLDALRAGDVAGVARAMEQDVEQGMEQMAGVLAENA